MRDISKSYYGNSVLKSVSLDVQGGEIHALCGENGAGKSTLMNILFGMPVIFATGGYEGSISLGGEEVSIRSPSDAMSHGIGMVHQEFMLIPGFSIAENIKLNREPLKTNLLSRMVGPALKGLDWGKAASDSRVALKKLGMDMDVSAPVASLPVGHMQFVEIAREIDKENLRILVFDEPTAVLGESEAAKLISSMKQLAAAGVGILLITHRLDEVMSVADRVTVLRDGCLVATMPKKETSAEKIAELMVGRQIDMASKGKDAVRREDLAVSIKSLRVDMPGEPVRGIDLDVYKGEILGLGGLAGQGKIGIANGLMGIYPSTGEVLVGGKKLELNNPRASIAAKLGFVSEDRRGVGLIPGSSIEMNIAISAFVNQRRFRKVIGPISLLDQGQIRETAEHYIKDLDIRCTGPTQAVRRLSGGNQQKVCIAKALVLEPDVLLVSEPTRGIDIGAKSLVLDTIRALNAKYGLTVIMTSSELAELRLICDRIAIIVEGKLFDILPPDAPDSAFGLAMSGLSKRASDE
jgi:simple sugar transport system ATP-binding protein